MQLLVFAQLVRVAVESDVGEKHLELQEALHFHVHDAPESLFLWRWDRWVGLGTGGIESLKLSPFVVEVFTTYMV